MIKLTMMQGEPVYVNPDKISYAYDSSGRTALLTDYERLYVKESPEEVAKKVLEYKLALINLNHDSVSPQAERALLELAGLEDTQ